MHEVQISSFAIGIYKVTRREFNLFVKETGYRHLGKLCAGEREHEAGRFQGA